MTVLGAVGMFFVATAQECLDYCFRNLSCVGVDITVRSNNQIECWPHVDASNYRDNNIFTQVGTDSYQLITRCSSDSDTTTTMTTTGAYSYRCRLSGSRRYCVFCAFIHEMMQKKTGGIWLQ